MQQSNGYYRGYIKQRSGLAKNVIAQCRVLGFEINEDLYASASSTFTVEAVPNLAKEGDIFIVNDCYGQFLYNGVIDSIENYTITCNEILTLFNDEFMVKPTDNSSGDYLYRAGALKSIATARAWECNDTITAQFLAQFNMMPNINSYGKKYSINYEESGTTNLYNEFKSMANYGAMVKTRFTADYISESAKPNLSLSVYMMGYVTGKTPLKLADNSVYFPTMKPVVESSNVNKLVIYDSTGTTMRGAYYLTENGVVTDSNDLTRVNVTKTKIVASDDTLESLVNDNIDAKLYNHKLEISMIYDNAIYKCKEWQLGDPFYVFINGNYYDSIYSGYKLVKEIDKEIENITLTFGKVRNKASQRWFQ